MILLKTNGAFSKEYPKVNIQLRKYDVTNVRQRKYTGPEASQKHF